MLPVVSGRCISVKSMSFAFFFVFVGQILKEIMVEDARIMHQNGDVDAFPVKNAVHRGSLGVGRLGEFLDRDLLFSQYLPDVFSYMHNLLLFVVEVNLFFVME